MTGKIFVKSVILRGSIMPWSLLIMLFTWSKWSHAMLELSNGRILDSRFPFGVKEHKHRRRWYQWEYRLDMTKFFTVSELQGMYVKASSVRAGYDLWFFPAYLFQRGDWQDPTKFVCYEFVAWVLDGYINLPEPPVRFVSRHLARLFKEERQPA